MDRLPKLFQFLIHFNLGSANGLLRSIDRIRQQTARFIDAADINAVLKFNALRRQEPAEVSEQFAFFDRFHITMTPSLSRDDDAATTEIGSDCRLNSQLKATVPIIDVRWRNALPSGRDQQFCAR